MRRALATVALLAGCSLVRNPHGGPEADAWEMARGRATRAASLHDRFETHAIASATYQSPEVRARRTAQLAAWKAMPLSEQAVLQAAEEAEAARSEEFLLSLFTSDSRDNDLDGPRSVWRVALVVEGESEASSPEVRLLPVDSQLRDLYPYIHGHDTVYRVRFPRREGPPLAERRFTLRIASSMGRLDFTFGN